MGCSHSTDHLATARTTQPDKDSNPSSVNHNKESLTSLTFCHNQVLPTDRSSSRSLLIRPLTKLLMMTATLPPLTPRQMSSVTLTTTRSTTSTKISESH